MAVIDTSMKFPNSCHECKKYNCIHSNYNWDYEDINYRTSRHPDCPLKEVPSGKWIPVSEELPLTEDEVLVTYIVNGNHKKRYVETAYYYPITDEWNSINDEYRIPNIKVEIIAWMPLPEPYVVDEQTGENT